MISCLSKQFLKDNKWICDLSLWLLTAASHIFAISHIFFRKNGHFIQNGFDKWNVSTAKLDWIWFQERPVLPLENGRFLSYYILQIGFTLYDFFHIFVANKVKDVCKSLFEIKFFLQIFFSTWSFFFSFLFYHNDVTFKALNLGRSEFVKGLDYCGWWFFIRVFQL